MTISVFEKLSGSRPINTNAAKAVSGGLAYTPAKKRPASYVHSDTPLRTRPFPVVSNPADNLTGLKIGRLRVIGQAADVKSRWVVRCVCGAYEYRRAAALRSKHPDARFQCAWCEHTARLRNGGFA